MDDAKFSRSARIDEFTESVEQLWQSEEQQSSGSSVDNGATGTESERGT